MLSDTSEAPQAVSIGLRNCYLARCSFRRPFAALPWVLPRPHKLFLLGFETAIWHFRSATSCFYWASKLLSGTSSAPPQNPPSSFRRPFAALPWVLPRPHELFLLGFENAIWHFRSATSCLYWASKLLSGTFSAPLKSLKTLKTLPAAFDGLRCFAMGPPEAPRAVSVGLRNCYLALPKRHKMFLLGFETAIWHVAAFDGLSLLCHGSSRGPTSCFCWASKLLSGTSEAPQAVCIGLRNCYLARFQHPLKASKPSKPSQQLSTAFAALPWVLPRPHELFLLGFETAIWPFRSATRCFYWVSKLLSGTFSAPLKSLKTLKTLETLAAAFDGLSLLCHGTSRGPTSCFCWAWKLLSGTSEAPQAVSIGLRNCYLARFQRPLKASKPSQQLSTAFRCFAMGPPEAPRAVSVGLRNCYLALPRRDKLFLLGFETAIWHVAAFDGLSLLCHGSSRGPTSCFCWASKLLSGTSEAPQAVSIYWASKLLSGTFSAPLKASKPSQQLSTAFRCFAMGPPEAPRAVSVGLRNCYLARFSAPLKSLKTLKTLPAAFDGLSLLCHGTSEAPQAVSIGRRKCYLARCSFRRPFAALPWVLLRPHELFLLGFETAIWHFRGATSCFY